jgi:GNAT superfamily N-acetyltransferase
VLIRDRTEGDISALEQLAREVHDLDGYPPYLPGGDLRGFIASPDALAAWVTETGGQIIGQVALHPTTSVPVMRLASKWLGQPSELLAVVARLLVALSARRAGVGRALLTTASEEARQRGKWPILDVASDFQAANGLYQSCGWTRAGEVTVRISDSISFHEFVYVGPRTL